MPSLNVKSAWKVFSGGSSDASAPPPAGGREHQLDVDTHGRADAPLGMRCGRFVASDGTRRVVVKSVVAGGVAERAGIEAGDTITSVDGTRVTTQADIVEARSAAAVRGVSVLSFTVQRPHAAASDRRRSSLERLLGSFPRRQSAMSTATSTAGGVSPATGAAATSRKPKDSAAEAAAVAAQVERLNDAFRVGAITRETYIEEFMRLMGRMPPGLEGGAEQRTRGLSVDGQLPAYAGATGGPPSHAGDTGRMSPAASWSEADRTGTPPPASVSGSRFGADAGRRSSWYAKPRKSLSLAMIHWASGPSRFRRSSRGGSPAPATPSPSSSPPPTPPAAGPLPQLSHDSLVALRDRLHAADAAGTHTLAGAAFRECLAAHGMPPNDAARVAAAAATAHPAPADPLGSDADAAVDYVGWLVAQGLTQDEAVAAPAVGDDGTGGDGGTTTTAPLEGTEAAPCLDVPLADDAWAGLLERCTAADSAGAGVLDHGTLLACLTAHGLREADARAMADAAAAEHADPMRGGDVDYAAWVAAQRAPAAAVEDAGAGADAEADADAAFAHLSPEGLSALRELFEAADTNHDKALTAAEIEECFVKYGLGAARAKEMAADALKFADTNRDGRIDYEEWINYHVGGREGGRDEGKGRGDEGAAGGNGKGDGDGGSDDGVGSKKKKGGRRRWKERRELDMDGDDFLLPPEVLEDLRGGFAQMDEDGSGSVTQDEIEKYLAGKGYDDADELAAALMARVDRDGSGEVSYVEFISCAMDR